MKFEEFGLNEQLLEAIHYMNYTEATEIQSKAIPIILQNKDVIGCAQTGTGKTAAFILPILNNIAKENTKGINTLVLVPTRELAIQVGKVLKLFSKNNPLNILVSYGGGALKEQKELLNDTDILVGTVGRISDYVEQDLFELGRIKTLVLDEVDSMMQKHFQDELNYILKTTPKK